VIAALILSALVLSVAMTIVAYMTWIERKVAARIQNRIGPYEVGFPHGWLQPLADIAKLIVKEDMGVYAVVTAALVARPGQLRTSVLFATPRNLAFNARMRALLTMATPTVPAARFGAAAARNAASAAVARVGRSALIDTRRRGRAVARRLMREIWAATSSSRTP